MENISHIKTSEYIRKIGDKVFSVIPLPKIHPDIISALSLIASIIFLLNYQRWYQITLLGIVLALDILDGAIAKKFTYRKNDEEKQQGWMIDVTIDRLSEGFIALAYFIPLFPLFIVNTFLTLFSYRKKIHIILPLRQLLFLYLLVTIMI